MYEEGDDEMKKTIAKAWTDARSGKAADPLKDYRWNVLAFAIGTDLKVPEGSVLVSSFGF